MNGTIRLCHTGHGYSNTLWVKYPPRSCRLCPGPTRGSRILPAGEQIPRHWEVRLRMTSIRHKGCGANFPGVTRKKTGFGPNSWTEKYCFIHQSPPRGAHNRGLGFWGVVSPLGQRANQIAHFRCAGEVTRSTLERVKYPTLSQGGGGRSTFRRERAPRR